MMLGSELANVHRDMSCGRAQRRRKQSDAPRNVAMRHATTRRDAMGDGQTSNT